MHVKGLSAREKLKPRTNMKCEPIRYISRAQTTSLSFTLTHGFTFGIRLPLSGLVEVPQIRRLAVQQSILFLLLTITTCRQSCLGCLRHSIGIPVKSQSGFAALFECQFQRVATALCALIFDRVSRVWIKMMRIIDLGRCQMAFLLCITVHTKHQL